MYKEQKIVIVTWRDIVSSVNWENEEQLNETTPPICHSIGWIHSIDDNAVKIVGTFADEGGEPDDDENIGDYLVIPRGAVVKIEYVSKSKKKKRKRRKK